MAYHAGARRRVLGGWDIIIYPGAQTRGMEVSFKPGNNNEEYSSREWKESAIQPSVYQNKGMAYQLGGSVQMGVIQPGAQTRMVLGYRSTRSVV